MRWLTGQQYARLPIHHRAVAWADSQVGVREKGRNRGADVEAYQEVAGLSRSGGFAWCACFVYWCLLKSGVRLNALPEPGRCAAVRNWVHWAKGMGRIRSQPARGRLFFWLDANYSGHIGFCLGSSVLGVFRTIEGNTDGGPGSRDGDGVYKRIRTVAQLRRHPSWGFIDLSNL